MQSRPTTDSQHTYTPATPSKSDYSTQHGFRSDDEQHQLFSSRSREQSALHAVSTGARDDSGEPLQRRDRDDGSWMSAQASSSSSTRLSEANAALILGSIDHETDGRDFSPRRGQVIGDACVVAHLPNGQYLSRSNRARSWLLV